ncbi:hypothetical protein P376_3332 [Streptomyces sp. HCCB10043]|nr:hypothetical protein P376_3332 [Streptomyces sp. HCCB10043]
MGQRAVVVHRLRRVVHRGGDRVGAGRAGAEPDERAGHLAQHEREVLGPGHRLRGLEGVVGAEDVAGGGQGEGGLVGVVDGRRVLLDVVDLRAYAVGGGHPVHGPFEGGADGGVGGVGEGADRRVEVRGGRDDVGGRTRVEAAHGDDGRIEDVDLAGDEGLERGDHGAHRGHRVGRGVRGRTVPAPAVHGDVDRVGRGEHGPWPGGGEAGRGPGGDDVQGVRGDDPLPRRVEDPLVDHDLRAALALLAGLEHEHHVPGQLRAPGRQQPGGADEAGGVEVVAAGVHTAVEDGGVREPGLLLDGQRVHVAAQQDGGAGAAAAQHGGDGAESRTEGDLQAEALQGGEDLGLRTGQIEAEFRLAVQGVAQSGEGGGEGVGVVQQGHGRMVRSTPLTS